ncbi:LLM class flavin-dependent oxidoreductase [Micromonospora sp. ATA51]|uniref:LLM class flavin-dependent oxidoreductase n=1 Tax=Micromonospora sp. ATA51 TaxID=2806098 RepID=UPI001EE4A60F|nr:LLM class flavin-dependent oxidoreductase [Micromonospora sp. ATA51]
MAIFSVQARPADAASWLDLARRLEAAGFDALLAADHPGHGASPFVSLAAAAAVTSTLGLGSYVSNAGVREPILLATDVATLDMVSGGRARLGLGAGHTPAEWRPSAASGPTSPPGYAAAWPSRRPSGTCWPAGRSASTLRSWSPTRPA